MIKKLLELHEGRVPYAYQDSLGYWTIGVGHLIDKRKDGGLPDQIIDLLLDIDIEDHKKRMPAFADKLDEVRYAVLLDMTFNLGSLDKWPIFRGQVERGEYAAAANNMRGTLWAKQVKSRAERLAKMMETGEWPEDLK